MHPFTRLNFAAISTALVLACGGGSGDTGGGSTDGPGGTGTTADATTGAPTEAGDASTADSGTTVVDTTAEPGSTTASSSGGDELADCGFDAGLEYARDALVLQLVSADGETCVWLERRDDSEPDVIYKAVPYTLLEFKAGHAGVVDHLTDPANMTWDSTHHNWDDVATAWNASVRYKLVDLYSKDFTFQFELSAYDESSDALLWGPVALVPFTP